MRDIYAVDFDGTLHFGEYPDIGKPNTALIDYLRMKQLTGSKIILWTCRCGRYLDDAVRFCTSQGLTFDAVNENLPEMIQLFGNDSRKIYADHYLDDKNMYMGYRKKR